MIERLIERRGWGLASCRAVLVLLGLFLLTALPASAQETPRNDTLRVDSTQAVPTDSLRVLDSLKNAAIDQRDSAAADDSAAAAKRPTRLLLRDVGAPLGSVVDPEEGSGYDLIAKRELVWERYFSTFDLLARRLPAVPLSMGAPGLVRGFAYAGASPTSISSLYNGRPLWGTHGRAYDLDFYPLEFIERLEVLRGARAAIFGSGTSLIALNFTQPRYDVEGSYARVWYSQGPNNTSGSDITFARNIGSRANLSLGFRRLVTDGVYTNQRVSGWSGRGSVRWDFSDKLVVSLTELHTEFTRGLNGGLTDSSSSLPLFSDIINDTLQEHVLRHDVTLAARWYPIGQAHGTGDSAVGEGLDTNFRIDGSIYYSYAERALMVGDSIAEFPGLTSRERAGMVGARAGITVPLVVSRLLLNGSFDFGDNGRLRIDAGGMLEIPGGRLITLRGGAKLHGYGDDFFVTAVGEGIINLGDSISIRGTVRNTTQILPVGDCPPVPLIAPDTLRPFGANSTGLFGEAELRWRGNGLAIEVGGYLRQAPELGCSGFAGYTIAGANATVTIPISFLILNTHLVATFASGDYRAFPLLHGVSDLHGQWSLLGGNLDLRLGTSLEYTTSNPYARYDAVAGELLASRNRDESGKPPFPLWNAYAQGRIGSAYLRVEMRNILDVEFATLERYPTFGRGIYLGVNWALID